MKRLFCVFNDSVSEDVDVGESESGLNTKRSVMGGQIADSPYIPG